MPESIAFDASITFLVVTQNVGAAVMIQSVSSPRISFSMIKKSICYL